VPARWEGGQLLFDLPTAAADGRLLLVCPR
jgi:hypothetical protein